MIAALLFCWASVVLMGLGTWAARLSAGDERRRSGRLAAVVAELPRCSECGELARWYAVPMRGSSLPPRCDAHVWSRRNLMEEFEHAPALRELRAGDLPATLGRAAADQLPCIMGNVCELKPRSVYRTFGEVKPAPTIHPPSDSTSRLKLPLLYGPGFDEEDRTAVSPQLPDEQETVPLSREAFRQACASYEASRKAARR